MIAPKTCTLCGKPNHRPFSVYCSKRCGWTANNRRYSRSASNLGAERLAMIDSLWRRWVYFCRLSKQDIRSYKLARKPASRLAILQRHLQSPPPGFRWRSAAEKVLLGIDLTTLDPCRPTTARPGTPEKVEVLMRRALAGKELWHAEDAGHA